MCFSFHKLRKLTKYINFINNFNECSTQWHNYLDERIDWRCFLKTKNWRDICDRLFLVTVFNTFLFH